MLRTALMICGLLLMAFGSSHHVLAQSAGSGTSVTEPLMGSEAAPGTSSAMAPATAPDPGTGFGGADGVYRILVLGDGLAGGFGAGLTRMVQDDSRFEVVNRFNEASGLARTEFYDWVEAIPKILIAKDYDAAIVHLGVNDRQAIRGTSSPLAFRSPEWIAAYTAQARALAEKLTGAGVHVYWLEVPPMADQSFNSDMAFISALQKQAIGDKGITYVRLVPALAGPAGQYSDRGLDETGVERKLRSRDGITFLKQGNNRVGQLLLAAVKSAVSLSPPAPAQTSAVPSPSAGIEAVQPSTVPDMGAPQFGQQGLNGEDIALNARDVVTQPAVPAAAVQPKPAAYERPKFAAAVGSAAELLFTVGEIPEAPAGRFDDFSAAPEPGN